MGALGRGMRAFGVVIIGEFLLFLMYFVVTGAFSDGPLQAVLDICESSGTTPVALATAIFIIGTILNIAVAVPLYVLFGRD